MCLLYIDLILSLIYALASSDRHDVHFLAGLTGPAQPTWAHPVLGSFGELSPSDSPVRPNN
jgi:hypothetical protein